MKNILRLAAIMSIALFAIAQMPTMAQVKASNKKAERLSGRVTAIDAIAGTITIHNKKDDTDTTLDVTPATTFQKSKSVMLMDIAAGDRIAVEAQDDLTPGATSITASRINIISPLAKEKKHEGKKSVEGIVSSVSPLIIGTDDGSTITVATDPTTKVYALKPAKISDVMVGARVQALGKTVNGSFEAKDITIEPAKGGKKRSI